ncbi:hypothetical protein [Leptonema illini]|uniref:Uncharacterized protein n=1 Tax=Leptonema illini DSM 21528 TaxID=929563 RepID=H2CLC3_9LEPT|nr:hypothetical protein [Leptonema illini]EHQ04534.1 hypothetical protein Lepil_4056 [Leptonema illini DSM 21528]
MSHIMVDIEADGPIPGDYSMIELGAVDDALGNAEAMIAMKTTLGLRIGLD